MTWPGAAPQEVEEQIVARIEEAVSDLDNIEWVRSTSAEAMAASTSWPSRRRFYAIHERVKTRVESISSFPRDMEPPQVRQWVNRDEFIRVAVSGDLDERELKRLAEAVAARGRGAAGHFHRGVVRYAPRRGVHPGQRRCTAALWHELQ